VFANEFRIYAPKAQRQFAAQGNALGKESAISRNAATAKQSPEGFHILDPEILSYASWT